MAGHALANCVASQVADIYEAGQGGGLCVAGQSGDITSVAGRSIYLLNTPPAETVSLLTMLGTGLSFHSVAGDIS